MHNSWDQLIYLYTITGEEVILNKVFCTQEVIFKLIVPSKLFYMLYCDNFSSGQLIHVVFFKSLFSTHNAPINNKAIILKQTASENYFIGLYARIFM